MRDPFQALIQVPMQEYLEVVSYIGLGFRHHLGVEGTDAGYPWVNERTFRTGILTVGHWPSECHISTPLRAEPVPQVYSTILWTGYIRLGYVIYHLDLGQRSCSRPG
jgi:hypothetical protein